MIAVYLSLIVCGMKATEANAQIPTLSFEQFKPLLNKQNDTIYVINFWATWCAPCVEELPDFEKINQKYKNKKFKMILVSLDFKKHKESRVVPFVEQHNLQASVVLLYAPDANAWINKVNKDWSGSIPATLIYSRKKRIFNEGMYTFAELDKIVNELMN